AVGRRARGGPGRKGVKGKVEKGGIKPFWALVKCWYSLKKIWGPPPRTRRRPPRFVTAGNNLRGPEKRPQRVRAYPISPADVSQVGRGSAMSSLRIATTCIIEKMAARR